MIDLYKKPKDELIEELKVAQSRIADLVVASDRRTQTRYRPTEIAGRVVCERASGHRRNSTVR